MKKRLLSLLLTVCLVAALFTGLTGTANAADDKVVGYLTSYTLKAGDTIYGVCEAKKIDFNANLAMIGKINGITNYNYMMPGKVILIPTKTVPGAGSYHKIMAHKIVSGDTLYALCASYGLDYYAYSKLISLLNPNAAYYNLLPGNILYMPQYVAASTTVKPAATPAPAAC